MVEAGTLDDIFTHPTHPYLKALLKAVPHFDMKPGERLKPIREIATPVEQLAGSPLIDRSGGTLVEVRHLTKRFGMRKKLKWLSRAQEATVLALADVSFTDRARRMPRPGRRIRAPARPPSARRSCAPCRWTRARSSSTTAATSTDLLKLDMRQMEPIRRKIQYIFQDPYSSLNPRMTVGSILAEPFVIHGIGTDMTRRAAAVRLLEMVGLGAQHLNRYPHSFSGGQRQRIGIARALALQPDLVICDEPVSALDVSIQAQILNLLKDLQKEIGLTYLFISHNLAVINYIADRIAVMCAGRLVELAPRAELFRNPVHPYTQALMTAVPYPDPDRPLDFDAIGAGRQSNPSRVAGAVLLRRPAATRPCSRYREGHFVRAPSHPPRRPSRSPLRQRSAKAKP